MKKTIFIISVAFLAFCLNACKSHSKVTAEATSDKISIDLAGTYWKLVELNGSPVEEGTSAKEPYITMEIADNRFYGNAGCNNFTGSFRVPEPGRIAFSQVVATRMMCLNMEIENSLLKMFDLIDSYTIKDDILTLANDQIPLARFAAMNDD